MAKSGRFTKASLVGLVFLAQPALAEEVARAPLTFHMEMPNQRDRGEAEPADATSAVRAADDGQLLPYTLGAAIPTAHADLKALGGYDTAAGAGRALTSAEARIVDFFALRAEYQHGPGTDSDDIFTLGGRFGILTQRRHGIDFGAGLFFQPKDFRGEGNIVAALLASRHFGRLGVFSDAMFGMDPEGDDGSCDLRLAGLYRVATILHIGLDARGRFNVSSDEKRLEAREIKWEFASGPVATLSLGPVALLAMAGPSGLELEDAGEDAEQTRFGMIAMAGAGGVF